MKFALSTLYEGFYVCAIKWTSETVTGAVTVKETIYIGRKSRNRSIHTAMYGWVASELTSYYEGSKSIEWNRFKTFRSFLCLSMPFFINYQCMNMKLWRSLGSMKVSGLYWSISPLSSKEKSWSVTMYVHPYIPAGKKRNKLCLNRAPFVR